MLSSPFFALALMTIAVKAAAQESGGFRYAVNDLNGNEQSHQQTRVGNGVKGQYKVLLPDGRLQTVTYVADENGYRAKVDYTPSKPGEATTAGANLPPVAGAASGFSPALASKVGIAAAGGYNNGGLAGGIVPALAPAYAPAFAPATQGSYSGGLASKIGSGPVIANAYGASISPFGLSRGYAGIGQGYGVNPYGSIASSGFGSYSPINAYLGGIRGSGPYGLGNNGNYGSAFGSGYSGIGLGGSYGSAGVGGSAYGGIGPGVYGSGFGGASYPGIGLGGSYGAAGIGGSTFGGIVSGVGLGGSYGSGIGNGAYGGNGYGAGVGAAYVPSSTTPIFGGGYPIGTSSQGSNGYSYAYSTPFSQVSVYSNSLGGYGY